MNFSMSCVKVALETPRLTRTSSFQTRDSPCSTPSFFTPSQLAPRRVGLNLRQLPNYIDGVMRDLEYLKCESVV